MSNRKKILLVGPALTLRGGVAHHIRILLKSPLNQDYDLLHFQVGREYHDGQLKIVVRLISTPLQFIRKLWTYQPDVIHFNPSFDKKSIFRELTMLVICQLLGVTSLVQFHGGNLFRLIRSNQLPFYIKFFIRWSSHCIVLTESQKLPLVKYFSKEKFTVIPNMVETSLFRGQKSHKRSNFKILFMSRIDKSKGVYDIVQAIPAILNKFPGTSFIFAGEGPDRTKLELLCSTNGLNERVRFLGYIDGKRKVDYLAQSDLFLFPSQLCEGMPYAVLEAMAAGLPIIATPVGAIPEIIKDGFNGVLIPPEQPDRLASSVIRLLRNGQLRLRLSKNSRYTAQIEYDQKIVCEKLGQLYEKLSDQRSTATKNNCCN